MGHRAVTCERGSDPVVPGGVGGACGQQGERAQALGWCIERNRCRGAVGVVFGGRGCGENGGAGDIVWEESVPGPRGHFLGEERRDRVLGPYLVVAESVLRCCAASGWVVRCHARGVAARDASGGPAAIREGLGKWDGGRWGVRRVVWVRGSVFRGGVVLWSAGRGAAQWGGPNGATVPAAAGAGPGRRQEVAGRVLPPLPRQA